jgi:lipid-binding SYLF domain-containing protein
MKGCVIGAVALLATATGAAADISPGDAQRLANAARVVQELRTSISPDYWDRAKCVVVIPDLRKAAFIVGGEYGKGAMSCRSGEQWTAPVFMQLAKGSWGFQAGAQQLDLVMLVMNESGVQKLLNNKVNLGADASVAAGPIGRQGGVGTDAQLTTEILSYARAQGLFAGIDISGGVLRPDEDADKAAYGSDASPRTILASREISAPTQASAFMAALGSGQTANTSGTTASTPARPPSRAADTTAAGQTPASSTPATPRTTTISTTDDDVRAQVTRMQETLDRLLADAAPAATGTTGTTGSTGGGTTGGMVTVDRARLVQLRQQLDALIAALNKR